MDNILIPERGFSQRIDITGEKEKNRYLIALRFENTYQRIPEKEIIYCNDEAQKEPGSIAIGIRQGIKLGCKRYLKGVESSPWKIHSKKELQERMLIRASARVDEPRYYVATKWRLDTPSVQDEVKRLVADGLFQHLQDDAARAMDLLEHLGRFDLASED